MIHAQHVQSGRGFQKGFQGVSLRGFRGFQIFPWELCVCIKYLSLGDGACGGGIFLIGNGVLLPQTQVRKAACSGKQRQNQQKRENFSYDFPFLFGFLRFRLTRFVYAVRCSFRSCLFHDDLHFPSSSSVLPPP